MTEASVSTDSIHMLDLMMPVMDGAQVRAGQRRDDARARVPVVLRSACGAVDHAERAVHPPGVLRKPARIGPLRAEIDGVAHRGPRAVHDVSGGGRPCTPCD